MEEFETLAEMVENSCAAYGERPLLGTRRAGHWEWTTYAEFGSRVACMRCGLRSLGVQVGDRVALISNNCEEWAVVACAAYGVGAQVVPLYEAQHADEWAYILSDSGAKVVFVANAAIAQKVSEARRALPTLEQ